MRPADLAHAAPALPGAHNAQNAAAATAMARFLGVSDARDRRRPAHASPACRTASSSSATIDGVHFVNDSKATNADAAERALVCYDRMIWIAGGMAKEGGIEPLAPYFPRIAHALLIGRDAPALRRDAGRARRAASTSSARWTRAVPGRASPRARGDRRAGGAAVAGLRQLGPVHRLRRSAATVSPNWSRLASRRRTQRQAA